jgi:hypothetical protein
LATAGIAGLIAAAEPAGISESNCNCSNPPTETAITDAGTLLAQAGAQPNAAAQPSEAVPLRAAAEPAYEPQPFVIAGTQYASRAAFIGQGRRCGTPVPTADELAIERNAVAAARQVEGA